ncbi:uncharacterized protein LOC142612104 [Castanea sativa]|uniref:uncharacterized protein LOC142612104 n=1 Tax=Castanea sativa TaxID=21020 RepID=UPI003F65061B
MGQVKVPVQTRSEVVEVNFIVVDAYSPYIAIMARPWLHAMGIVPSTLHLKVKYPSRDRVEELIRSQSTVRQCMVAAIRHQAEDGSSASNKHGKYKEKYFQVGAQLPPQEKEELMKFLKGNLDVFSWNTYEALRIDPSFICHHLNVNPAVVPRKQSPQRSSKEYSKAVKEEVIKLKQVGAIKELGKSIEVYVDDMVVKSKVVSKHVGNLGNVFETLRKYKLCLNTSKCSFGVGSGKFLGFMVTHLGIKVNPDQVKAINSLQPPRNLKEV